MPVTIIEVLTRNCIIKGIKVWTYIFVRNHNPNHIGTKRDDR